MNNERRDEANAKTHPSCICHPAGSGSLIHSLTDSLARSHTRARFIRRWQPSSLRSVCQHLRLSTANWMVEALTYLRVFICERAAVRLCSARLVVDVASATDAHSSTKWCAYSFFALASWLLRRCSLLIYTTTNATIAYWSCIILNRARSLLSFLLLHTPRWVDVDFFLSVIRPSFQLIVLTKTRSIVSSASRQIKL